jgi:catechol 2,3-dioxygenase-like lactoylglutathione lyase family enzyme
MNHAVEHRRRGRRARLSPILALASLAPLALGCAGRRAPPLAPASTGGTITGIDHVAFVVADLAAARGFYGDLLGLPEVASAHTARGAAPAHAAFAIGARQRIEVQAGTAGADGRLGHVAFTARGLPAGRWSALHDPDGHRLEIVGTTRPSEAAPSAVTAPIYHRLVHVGLLAGSLAAALEFYRGRLGFQEFWRGGSDAEHLDWVNLRTPGGEDYVELMLYAQLPPPEARGGKNHVCLFVADVTAAVAAIEARPARQSYTRPIEIKIGRNRKRQVNLFDPDGNRVELMEPQTIDGQPAPSSAAPPPRP